MKQNPIQSQTTPQGTLYQSPTSTNTVKYKSKSGLVLASIIIIVMCVGGLFSCTAHQNAVAKIGSAQA
ncbi:hypothetical protein [Acinetobacter sp. ANC 3832]|uniref:hypothetical protein n=1 Tax=Acinetobacter sp. ANC 3832 TaxID=1977874 RepID=UPI000A344746|nr:hypothetical protein [Acinetobacter sp. ANC 3832]OTG93908.1 hypothetical protein B9T35_08170 [Acinetobacter sp. ANC 3832]